VGRNDVGKEGRTSERRAKRRGREGDGGKMHKIGNELEGQA
jgi:hypothetical protein